MYSLDRLQAMRADSKRQLDGIKAESLSLNDKVLTLKSDKSRDPNWLNNEIDNFRRDAMKGIGERAQAVLALADDAAAQRRFWSSRSLVMGRRRFHGDPASDAAMRSATLAEMSVMSSPLLQLTAEAALAEQDVPRLAIALLIGATRADQAWKGVDLDKLNLPEQDGALATIAAIEADAAEARLLVAQTMGRVVAPTDKLTLARMRTSVPKVPPIEESHQEATEQTAQDAAA